MRQPLEEKQIVLSRTAGTFRFPADFMLVGAMNPCPCGYYPDRKRCVCTPTDIYKYRGKISQPFLDRMDLRVEVEPVRYSDLLKKREGGTDSRRMRESVMRAVALQRDRYAKESFVLNSGLGAQEDQNIVLSQKRAAERWKAHTRDWD